MCSTPKLLKYVLLSSLPLYAWLLFMYQAIQLNCTYQDLLHKPHIPSSIFHHPPYLPFLHLVLLVLLRFETLKFFYELLHLLLLLLFLMVSKDFSLKVNQFLVTAHKVYQEIHLNVVFYIAVFLIDLYWLKNYLQKLYKYLQLVYQLVVIKWEVSEFIWTSTFFIILLTNRIWW